MLINLDELYIVNYCHPACMPMKNIMRLEGEAAFALAAAMAAQNANTNAFYRFADFANYYPLRKKVDQILYRKFIDLGGNPQTAHPLFFVLHGSEYLKQWFGNGIERKILLKSIPSEHISFTYGDSCASWRKNGDIMLLTKDMLLASIGDYAGSADAYLQEATEKYYYIEVQLWSDD